MKSFLPSSFSTTIPLTTPSSSISIPLHLLINNSSMLNVAVNKGYEEIVILLITRCEHDIDQLDINNNSLLHMAVNNNNYRMTYLLLHMDISPNLFNKDKSSRFNSFCKCLIFASLVLKNIISF